MKKLLVIGGGFAGTLIAKKLEKKFNTTLIDAKEYFEYTPGILRTIVEPKHLKKIQVLHKNYLKKAKILIAGVKEINKKYVIANNKKLRYDYIVICSGSDYNPPIKEQNASITMRAKHLQDSHNKLLKAKDILLIGGGLVGIELAAEICTNYKNKNIMLVHSGKHLVQRNNPKTIKYAENFLEKKGVKLLLNERVNKEKSEIYVTQTGKKIKADMAFLSTGIKPNSEFMKTSFPKALNENNQIKVNDYLQVANYKNIFAAGDITSINEEKTAQNAKRQAKVVIKNLLALEQGEQLKKYKSKKTLLVISLGKYNGILEYKNIVIYGKIPALLKWLIEKLTMWRYK